MTTEQPRPYEHDIRDAWSSGADAQLDLCIRRLNVNGCPGKWLNMLRSMRPTPRSLKQRALEALTKGAFPTSVEIATIRRALEALPDDD